MYGITLIVGQSDVQLPVFDTTRLHSQMAVDFILGRYEPRPPVSETDLGAEKRARVEEM